MCQMTLQSSQVFLASSSDWQWWDTLMFWTLVCELISDRIVISLHSISISSTSHKGHKKSPYYCPWPPCCSLLFPVFRQVCDVEFHTPGKKKNRQTCRLAIGKDSIFQQFYMCFLHVLQKAIYIELWSEMKLVEADTFDNVGIRKLQYLDLMAHENMVCQF